MKLIIIFKKYRVIIMVAVLSFYLGCFFTTFWTKEIEQKETNELKSFHDEVKFVAIVFSAPNNLERRNIIRKTWYRLAENIFYHNDNKMYHRWRVGKDAPFPDFLKIYFVIGTQSLTIHQELSLNKENRLNGDLLLLNDLEDKYESLSLKLYLSLKWLHTNIKNLQYAVKADDDSFVRIDLIVIELDLYGSTMIRDNLGVQNRKKSKPYKGLYWGYFDGRAKPKSKGKWTESSWFLCDMYLPYALGGGYVLSASIVKFIADNGHLFKLYISEDVSLGVWTASLDQINRLHDTRFDTEWTSRGCMNNQLIKHKQTDAQMSYYFKKLTKSKGYTMCSLEVLNRETYKYNWTAPPSKCCQKN